MLSIIARHDWPIDSGLHQQSIALLRDVSCGIQVGVEVESAVAALEPVADSLTEAMATAAHLACVGCSGDYKCAAVRSELIVEELLKLGERPAVEPTVVPLVPLRCASFTDACQVFDRNGEASTGDTFTNAVVRVSLEPLFSSAQAAEMPLRTASADRLQRRPVVSVTSSDAAQLLAVEELRVGGHDDVIDASVDADARRDFFLRNVGEFPDEFEHDTFRACGADAHRVDAQSSVLLEVRRNAHGDGLATIERRDGEFVLEHLRCERAQVVADGGEGALEWQLLAFLPLEHVGSAIPRSLHETRLQARESLAHRGIVQLQLPLGGGSLLEAERHKLVAALVEHLDGVEEVGVLADVQSDGSLSHERFKYHMVYLNVMETNRSSSSVNEVAYHIVWCPKYRNSLSDDVQSSLKLIINSIAAAKGWEVRALEANDDHVHVFLQTGVLDAPVGIVKSLKGTTAKLLFEKHPELRKDFRKGHLWSPSYYVGSVGHVSEATVKKYVEEQRQRTGKPGRPKRASPPLFEKRDLRRHETL